MAIKKFQNQDQVTQGVHSQTAAGPYTADADDTYISVNQTVAAAITINLPTTPALGRTCVIKDSKGDAGTFNITVDGNGANIDGSSTFIINSNYASITFVFNGTGWDVN